MKKILSLALVLILGMGLTGCNGKTAETKKKRIGVLQIVQHSALDKAYSGLIDGLADIGITKENTIIDYQVANGDVSLANTMAKKMVDDKCDLIIALATPTAQAAFNATRGTDIPVVFVAVSDPIAAKIIDNREHPTTNVTGISDLLDADAQLEITKTLLPNAKTIGMVYTASEANSASEVALVKEKAEKLGYKVETTTIATTADVPLAMDAILAKGVDVILNTHDNTLISAIEVEVSKATAKNVPIIGSVAEQVQNGALASNGFDSYDKGVVAVPIVQKVLSGTKPGDIPVENCGKTVVYVNRAAAEKYGVTIPEGANII